MNDNILKKALIEEHKNIDAPAELKSKVSRSIDGLLLLQSLLELYGNIPHLVIQSLVIQKEKRDDTKKTNQN
jgi:hypothetical protein